MKRFLLVFIPGIFAGVLILLSGNKAIKVSSTNEYCISCHIHPAADASWKKSVHYQTRSGIRITCVECHLPPEGEGYLLAKTQTGLRDLWNKWTRDSASFNWEDIGRLENARHYTYELSCIKCHENLFPAKLSKAGEDAHLYYTQTKKTDDLHCINCHLNAGHYIEGYTHGSNKTFGAESSRAKEIYTKASTVDEFRNFTEYIPKSPVSFNMIAIPGGSFKMGSPPDENLRKENEGPVRDVVISPFFMAEIEVSWDEYLAFYAQTSREGRTTDTEGLRNKKTPETDAISGATPPYGQPDQGWGLGQRPAISYTFNAAETYCKWLSSVTGKHYRIPTEAEWEYGCRAGTQTPYFFPGDPGRYDRRGLKARISKNDTSIINSFTTFKGNSPAKTRLPAQVQPNQFGLRNMAGNVAEFCSDWYQPDSYSKYPAGIVKDPKGPESGTEHVLRGGSYLSTAGFLRSASRDYTRTDAWLKTDPQIPKSIWWYSDCFYTGFRVVCDFDQNTGKKE